jgi:cytochrome c-type biogenesis protein
MELIGVSFIAGALTVLAPCILPLLPVILVRSAGGSTGASAWLHPVVIVVSLCVSVIVFSLLLKASTALLGVPTFVWQSISGGILVLFGFALLFPGLWARATSHLPMFAGASKLAGSGYKQQTLAGSALIGLALGPIFNSCSPTYALIVASILPASFSQGLAYLFAYSIGLAVMLFAIAIAGQKITQKLGWLTNPHGIAHKVIAIVLIAVGVAILTGLDKQVQTFVLEQGWYDPLSQLEESLRP